MNYFFKYNELESEHAKLMFKHAELLIENANLREAVKAEREVCAEIAETDSILDWAGGSTGNAKGTAIRIARAIRARNDEKAV